MKKAKVILKETKADDNGLNFVSKSDGDVGICLSMCLGYVADVVVDNEVSLKEATQLLKNMVKEETDRRGKGTWL